MNTKEIKQHIPTYVFDVGRILAKEGFEAYLVGGGVRDILRGKKPKDFDIGTNAVPDQMTSMFNKVIMTGAKFGSIIVMVKDEEGETHAVDVTTYRTEEQYISGRWPSKVEFTTDIKDDLSRRDFTINAMALDLEKIRNEEEEVLLDPFGGMDDIRDKIVRAVGDAQERLHEDALRALRACRFSSVLGYELDPQVKEAIPTVLTMIDNISAERVKDEFLKILYDSPKPSVGLKLMHEVGILEIWIPELLEGIGVEQPEYHTFDVYEHSMRTVDIAEDEVKVAALFHDIGKPRTHENGHFYRHDIVGAEMTKEILKRLRFSNKEIEKITTLVRWHMFYFPYDTDDLKKVREEAKKRTSIAKWGDAAIRRFVRNVGGEDAIDDLIKLRIADATANPMGSFDEKEIIALQNRIAEVREKDMVLKPEDLDVSGQDLIELGINPGPKMGHILNELVEEVIEEPALNDKDRLLEIVKERYLK